MVFFMTKDVGFNRDKIPEMETLVHDVIRDAGCEAPLVEGWKERPDLRQTIANHILEEHQEAFVVHATPLKIPVLNTERMADFAQYVDMVHVTRILQGKDADDSDELYLYRRGQ